MVELVILSGIIVVQQVFYMYHQHKLINKLMSRNYHEYVASTPKPKQNKVSVDEAEPWEVEDFRGLPEIGI